MLAKYAITSAVRFVVGSQYVCLQCLTRGVSLRCTRCLELNSVIDLKDKAGRHKLATIRASVRLGSTKVSPFDWDRFRALPVGRQGLWILSRIAFVLGILGWMLAGPKQHSPEQMVAALMISFVIGAFAVVVAYAMVVVALLAMVGTSALYALLCRSVAETLRVFAPGERAQRIQLSGEQFLHSTMRWIERGFLLRIKIESAMPDTGEHRAVVGTIEGAPLQVLMDQSSDFELCDALSTQFSLRTDENPANLLLIDCEHAVIELDDLALLGKPSGAIVPALELSWLPVEQAERDKWQQKSLQDALQVQITGGEWHHEVDPTQASTAFRQISTRTVIRGTAAAPLFVKVLSKPKR